MLKENFKALGAVVGGGLINAFKPFIKVLNAVLQKVIAFAEMVTNALGSIFGWKYEASDVGITDDLADSYGNVADAANDAANGTKKAAKEAKKSTRAFDELKVISSNKDKGSSGGGSGSSGGGGGASGSSGKLVQTDTIFKDYESKIKDLEGLGESIRDALVNAVGSIEWDKVYAKASGFGTGLAEFLNGLFSEDKKGNSVFTATADVIAGALNTAIFASKGFTDKFDFETFGKNVAHGFNRFFKKFKWKQCAEAINGWVDGFWETVTSFFGNLEYGDIFNGLKEFITNLSANTIATIIGIATIKKFGGRIVKAICDNVGDIGGKLAIKLGEKVGSIAITSSIVIGIISVSFSMSKSLSKSFFEWYNEKYGTNYDTSKIDELSNWEIVVSGFKLSFNENGKFQVLGLENLKKLFPENEVVNAIYELLNGAVLKAFQNFSWDGFWDLLKEKIGERPLAVALNIVTKPKELFEKFKESWEVRNLAVTLSILTKAKTLFESFKESWGNSRILQVSMKISTVASALWETFKEKWGVRKLSVTLSIMTKAKELFDNFKDKWGKRYVSIGLSLMSGALSGLWKRITTFFSGKSIGIGASARKKADGGVFSGGSWKPIKKYAVGGLPNMGQMFVAREAGPELVGTLGGHTAVMNNDQIVSSVSYGVAQAVKEVIQPLVKMGGGNNRPIQISLDGKVIFDSTRQSAQEYFNRTGMSPFPV